MARRGAAEEAGRQGGILLAWTRGMKSRGKNLEHRGRAAEAEELRCHRLPEPSTGRCYLHGGTSKDGPTHQSYKHGFYSTAHRGILARAGDAHEAIEILASSHDELAVHKALMLHKLEEIHADRFHTERG